MGSYIIIYILKNFRHLYMEIKLKNANIYKIKNGQNIFFLLYHKFEIIILKIGVGTF